MSARIVISASTNEILAALAEERGMVMGSPTSTALPDGRWEIEVDDEVFASLEFIAPGDPDAAIRALATHQVGRS